MKKHTDNLLRAWDELFEQRQQTQNRRMSLHDPADSLIGKAWLSDLRWRGSGYPACSDTPNPKSDEKRNVVSNFDRLDRPYVHICKLEFAKSCPWNITPKAGDPEKHRTVTY